MEKNLINVDHTLVIYNRKGQRGELGINSAKTMAGCRTIPMLPIVKEALLEEKQKNEDYGIKCTAEIDGYTDFIFLNHFGKTQHRGSLNSALRRIIRDCNQELVDKQDENNEMILLPNFSNHSLRHTFTTRMCEMGVNMKAMQSILGHSDVRITMNIYADATKDLVSSEMQRLEDYFK